MLIFFHLLLVFGEMCCANDLFYETKAVTVGDHVKLNCSRGSAGELVWMRIVSDNPPENLTQNKTPNVKVNPEPGSLELKITEAKLNDTALYICMRIKDEHLLSFNVTYLRVEELAVTEAPPSTPSIPVCPRDSLTLQCSVLHKSLRNSCPSNESAFCFSVDFSEPDPNNTKNNRANEEENTFEGNVITKCASFSNNFISSDGWTYFCAVPKCKDKTPVETSQINTGANIWTSRMQEVAIKCLTAALFVSHIIIVFLIYLVKKLKK
uniref:Immunoglobulin domain-containing protein n=1 Tax=Oryzias latipes TaxID=8090 RepID=A0A3B3HPF2_ORYLA